MILIRPMSVVWMAFLFAVAMIGIAASGTEESKTKRFKAGAIQLEIPDTWKQAKTKSRFHLAQFEIANPMPESINTNDFYLLQLSGPDALVKETVPALRASIGAQPDTEQPYELKGDTMVRSEQEWKKLLTREEYRVLRQKGTEQPFVNKYDKHFEPGTYSCAGCGQELFSSETKFNSGCGWPAFYAAKAEDRVVLSPDHSGGRIRTEVTCARCGSHLGHIFNDAPQTPTGNRYCINSVALKFTPAQNEQTEKDTTNTKE